MPEPAFRVFVSDREPDETNVPAPVEPDASADEIEEAYRRALGAIEAFEAADVEHFGAACRPESADGADDTPSTAEVGRKSPPETPARRVSPQQIIEAVLFVGGGPMPTRKLVDVLRGEFEAEFVDRTIDELNEQYRAENRPYYIANGDDGYRMELVHEFTKVRHRVFGLAPREVRLGQDALEILALVAYRQPISRKEIDELAGRNAGSVLNQLVRRELLAVTRSESGEREVTYRTTPRFLQVFGLRSVDDLPQAEALSFK